MKLLFVTARFPYPPHKGDQAIPYYRLKYLSKDHEITLITFYESDEELMLMTHVLRFCKKVIPVKKSRFRSVANMVGRGLFSPLPLQVLYYRSQELTRAVKKELAQTQYKYDLLHVYMLRIAYCGMDTELPNVLKIPKVLELIDSMQLNFKRRTREETFPAKLLFNLERKRLEKYENEMVKHYDRCIVVSDKDREYIGADNIETIPLGIDTEQFRPRPEPQVLPDPVLAFTGNMGYFPNRNAILWFMHHCWPLIKKEVPRARLTIAGKGPGKAIKSYHDNRSVQVLGFVESMVDVLHRARVAIAPMQSGSGMQFKILEAMACGVPVVTTKLGLGTIPAQHNRHILVGDSPQDFAQCCIGLLKEDSRAESIGKTGMDMVRERFGWENNVEGLCKLYNSVLVNK